MAYKESDYPALVQVLEELAFDRDDPLLSLELLRETLRMVRRIPIYPGIAAYLARGLLVASTAGQLELGEIVVWEDGDRSRSGRITAVGKGGVLVEPLPGAASGRWTLAPDRDVRRLDRKALDRAWPTLVEFGEEG